MDEKLIKQLEKADAILKSIDSEYITQPELEEVVGIIIATIEKSAETFQKKLGDMTDAEVAFAAQCSKAVEDCKTTVEAKLKTQYDYMAKVRTQDIQDAVEQAVARISLIKGERGADGAAGKDGAAGAPGKDGSPDTPDQVTDKVNLGKPLIKKERVEGLADIERMAKANSSGFNPTMGPSFSDLRDIRTTITTLQTREGAVTINYIIDGGGSAITTGVKGFIEIPYNMTISAWQVFADQSGSVVVDVWRSTYATFPPVVGGSIAGSEKPTLASAQSNQDVALSTWTTALSTGDILAYNVDSVSTVTRITVALIGIKT